MEGDGLAGAVFRCIQEMDIDNRMSVSIDQETSDLLDLDLQGMNLLGYLIMRLSLCTHHISVVCIVCVFIAD